MTIVTTSVAAFFDFKVFPIVYWKCDAIVRKPAIGARPRVVRRKEAVMGERHELMGGEVYLHRRSNSTHWQCATYLAGKNWRKSTKEESLSLANISVFEKSTEWRYLRDKIPSMRVRMTGVETSAGSHVPISRSVSDERSPVIHLNSAAFCVIPTW